MKCIPSETCEGDDPWPLWAEIWAYNENESCWLLRASIGEHFLGDRAFARVEIFTPDTYPSSCWYRLELYLCDGTTAESDNGGYCLFCEAQSCPQPCFPYQTGGDPAGLCFSPVDYCT